MVAPQKVLAPLDFSPLDLWDKKTSSGAYCRSLPVAEKILESLSTDKTVTIFVEQKNQSIGDRILIRNLVLKEKMP